MNSAAGPPLPQGMRLWEPPTALLTTVAAAESVTWQPETSPVLGARWTDGCLHTPGGRRSDRVTALDVAAADDDGCGQCLTDTELTYALWTYAETGTYLVLGDDQRRPVPVVVLPGPTITAEHLTAALHDVGTRLLRLPAHKLHLALPLQLPTDPHP